MKTALDHILPHDNILESKTIFQLEHKSFWLLQGHNWRSLLSRIISIDWHQHNYFKFWNVSIYPWSLVDSCSKIADFWDSSSDNPKEWSDCTNCQWLKHSPSENSSKTLESYLHRHVFGLVFEKSRKLFSFSLASGKAYQEGWCIASHLLCHWWELVPS